MKIIPQEMEIISQEIENKFLGDDFLSQEMKILSREMQTIPQAMQTISQEIENKFTRDDFPSREMKIISCEP
jgi:hypothetical protein